MPLFPRNRSAVWRAINDLKEQQMATQAEVDAITTEVQTVATDLATV
jgi:hypothetical protein